MKKNILIIIISNFLITGNVSANGGPIDFSLFRKTQNIKLIKKANVKLLAENLQILIDGDYTIVTVKYKLKNLGNEQEIWYGFPIDVLPHKWGNPGGTGMVLDGLFENSKMITYFKVSDNTGFLKHTYFDTDSVYSISLKYNRGGLDNPYIIQRRWYVLKIDFEKEEAKDILIEYKIRNRFKDGIHGFRYVEYFSNRNFTYHLIPSSNWGDGIVENFSLSIDISNLAKNKIPYLITGVEGLSLNNDIYSFSVKKYDLTKSERININYDNSHIKLSGFINDNKIPVNMIKSIKASVNQEDAQNLIDGNPATKWNGNKNDWIEIEFYKFKDNRKWYKTDTAKRFIRVRGVLALNGDFSTKENFAKNNLAKNILVSYNYGDFFRPKNGEYGKIVKLPYKSFIETNNDYTKGLSTVFADGHGLYNRKYDYIWRIKVKIIDFYDKNKQNKSISISELYFVY